MQTKWMYAVYSMYKLYEEHLIKGLRFTYFLAIFVSSLCWSSSFVKLFSVSKNKSTWDHVTNSHVNY